MAFAGYLRRHVWGKWRQLGIIRRLVIVWWGVLLLSTAGLWGQIQALQPYYTTKGAISGGQYIEGEVGTLKQINPVLPENSLSADVSKLIFSGLIQIGPNREVEPDLASSWSVSPDGKSYTFNLRHNAHWHDGVPFTARDVLFTLAAIQNPDTRSPLASSWVGVKAEARDDYTIVLTLPNAYSPFIYSATIGVLPSHILETSDPGTLRVADFNQHPIGTGPFKLKSFSPSAGEIELTANSDYHLGKPKIDNFSFRYFSNYNQLIDAYAKRQVSSISRWLPNEPASRQHLANLRQYQFGLADQTDLFLRTTAPLLGDKLVRAALSKAIDRSLVIENAIGGNAVPISQPIMPGQLGYIRSKSGTQTDLAAAEQLLTTSGWITGPDGIRHKGDQVLRLKLLTSEVNNYPKVAEAVKKQWSKVGVAVDITVTDLANLEQTYIKPRNFDVLLYGINIGADPDVYAYWHSSQVSDPGINLSQYASGVADKALESGRIATDLDVRTGKYHTFLQAWNEDVPAIVLYQPQYIYAATAEVMGISAHRLVEPSDRFYGVENWTARTKIVPKGQSR